MTADDNFFMQALNLTFKITTTSLTTSILTAPITILLSNKQKPDMIKSPAVLSAAKVFWQVFQSQAIANQKRGAVSVTSTHFNKRNTVEELPIENNEETLAANRVFYSATMTSLIFSQADTAAAAVFNNRAKLLSRQDIAHIQLTKNNIRQLFFMGYPVKSMANFITFLSLLKLSNTVSNALPANNTTSANFIGGALTGMISSTLSHPFSAMNDRIVLNTRITAHGELQRISSMSFFKNNTRYIKTIGLDEATKQFWLLTRNELPLRMLSTMVVFSIIQGFEHLMGDKPLNRLLRP